MLVCQYKILTIDYFDEPEHILGDNLHFKSLESSIPCFVEDLELLVFEQGGQSSLISYLRHTRKSRRIRQKVHFASLHENV